MAGTPNIIGIIRIKKILQLKNLFFDVIQQNEHAISQYVFCAFKKLSEVNDKLTVILPDCNVENRLPIVCISINNIHYNLIVALLSDLFGIQTRGGVSCTGILAELIEKKYGIKGWCRITFYWLHDKQDIEFIIDAIKYILDNGHKYKDKYDYNEETNLFIYKNES